MIFLKHYFSFKKFKYLNHVNHFNLIIIMILYLESLLGDYFYLNIIILQQLGLFKNFNYFLDFY